jgi:lipopolysaccharide/colanic/teichoic acid biosynthesis glycosyltransferase
MPVSKRLSDIVLCLAALVFLGPLMLVIALLIKVSSRGPVLYKASRAGYRGQCFNELKFRTMCIGADSHGAFTSKDDPRILPFGKIIRLLKLDELPQILNILRGEMSVVGPRPEDLSIVNECYGAREREVLEVLPGLTGFPQVQFFPELCVIDPNGMDPQQHYRDVILPMRLSLDLEYIHHQSFWLDTRLIFQTLYLICVKSWSTLIFGLKTKNVHPPGTFEA